MNQEGFNKAVEQATMAELLMIKDLISNSILRKMDDAQCDEPPAYPRVSANSVDTHCSDKEYDGLTSNHPLPTHEGTESGADKPQTSTRSGIVPLAMDQLHRLLQASIAAPQVIGGEQNYDREPVVPNCSCNHHMEVQADGSTTAPNQHLNPENSGSINRSTGTYGVGGKRKRQQTVTYFDITSKAKKATSDQVAPRKNRKQEVVGDESAVAAKRGNRVWTPELVRGKSFLSCLLYIFQDAYLICLVVVFGVWLRMHAWLKVSRNTETKAGTQ